MSIERQEGVSRNKLEVLLCGDCSHSSTLKRVDRYLPDEHAANKGFLGRLRNTLVRNARYEDLLILDDDIILHPHFVRHFQAHETSYEVVCPKMINADGSRCWDWAIRNEDEHRLLDYNEWHPDLYISCGRMLIKKSIHLKNPYNESIPYQQGEDVEFSQRLVRSGVKVHFSEQMLVIHDDWWYSATEVRGFRRNVFQMLFHRLWSHLFPSKYAGRVTKNEVLSRRGKR